MYELKSFVLIIFSNLNGTVNFSLSLSISQEKKMAQFDIGAYLTKEFYDKGRGWWRQELRFFQQPRHEVAAKKSKQVVNNETMQCKEDPAPQVDLDHQLNEIFRELE